MVVPYPSVIFTSMMVHLNLFFLTSILATISYLDKHAFTILASKSGMPSPVFPDVGTKDM